MNAEQILAETDRLLRDEVRGTRGLWPRACVWMLRLALETALAEVWARTRPEIARVPTRAQLLVLPTVVGDEVGQRVNHLWVTLSSVGHHHSYELAPTAAELRGWHNDVSSAVAGLSSRTPRGTQLARATIVPEDA